MQSPYVRFNVTLEANMKKMNRLSMKSLILKSLLLSLLIVVGSMATTQAQSEKSDESLRKLLTAMQYIRMYYVDSIDEPELVENAIVETLKELDPHSMYIPKEDLREANEPLEGSFEGIGVTFQIYEDTILVISPVPGGPSDKLGIMAGDKIVKINGEKATGEDVDNQFVMDRLRGEKGTTVDVTIYRPSRDRMIEYTITRDKIPLNSIDATFMASPDIGYIKLNRFSKTSTEEFENSIEQLKEQGMKKLVLDLRGNSGGFLFSAVDLADQFLPNKKLLVYTKGLKSYPRQFYATSEGDFEEGDLVIMINEGSASASEIVAGAVQDWDRGIILGRRSFGKGLVQQPFRLPDSSFIRLTTAKYYTPTGRGIQRPYDEGTKEYYLEIRKRLENGELFHADSISFPDSLKYTTPQGRIVYGGGGIMPDIFTPWDSTHLTDYFTDLIRKGVFNDFVLNYLDENRSELLEEFPDITAFKEGFRVSDEMYQLFIQSAEELDVEAEKDEIEKSTAFIKTRIRALIARNLWDVSAFFEIIVEIDNEYQKAVEILENGDVYETLGLKSDH